MKGNTSLAAIAHVKAYLRKLAPDLPDTHFLGIPLDKFNREELLLIIRRLVQDMDVEREVLL